MEEAIVADLACSSILTKPAVSLHSSGRREVCWWRELKPAGFASSLTPNQSNLARETAQVIQHHFSFAKDYRPQLSPAGNTLRRRLPLTSIDVAIAVPRREPLAGVTTVQTPPGLTGVKWFVRERLMRPTVLVIGPCAAQVLYFCGYFGAALRAIPQLGCAMLPPPSLAGARPAHGRCRKRDPYG